VQKLADISFLDTLLIHPCTLDGRVHAADGPSSLCQPTSVLLSILRNVTALSLLRCDLCQ